MVLSSLHTSLRAFDFGSGGPLACFSHVFTNMFDRRCADMFGHVCLFGSGGPLACLVMFKQTCWELWSLLHMAHWHVYILFDRLTCTMTCQVKQMIGIVSWASPVTKASDKSGVNKLFWNVMVGITRSKVIGVVAMVAAVTSPHLLDVAWCSAVVVVAVV